MQPYVPGKPVSELERELGIHDSIKLASNENPLGPPTASLDAMRGALGSAALYPDGAAHDLKQGLAAHLGVSPAQLTIGNGSNEILSLLAETFLTPADEAVYSEYAFVVYALAVQAVGATARVAPALGAGDAQPFGHDLAAFRSRISDRTRLVFIANPNNPTGTWIPGQALRRFLEQVPAHALVVLDEAYGEYAAGPDAGSPITWLEAFPNLVLCRTFSKIYGLAGLRVGYAITHPDIAELLNRVRQPFNVNALAQVAALAALGATEHVERSRVLTGEGLAQLTAGLTRFGWAVSPSAGNFVLVDTGGAATVWYEGLLRSGIIVRPVASYGLPRHLRITVGLPEQNERLLRTLHQLRTGGGGA